MNAKTDKVMFPSLTTLIRYRMSLTIAGVLCGR